MLRRDAVAKFLHQQVHPVAKLYTPAMEVQINVAQDGGELIKGVFEGHNWHGYTDGLTSWKSIRIPWSVGDRPTYTDKEIKYDISQHALAIGMTGWDWQNLRSRWVAFDFDSIIGHKEGLSDEELSLVKEKIKAVSFVTIYTSTRGNGFHVYVFIKNEVKVNNHTEHQAIAQAILQQLSAHTGLELASKVDVCGSNMWVWHREATGYKLIKQGIPLEQIPKNWRKKSEKKSIPPMEQNQLLAAQVKVSLDANHRRLIEWLEKSSALYWWNDEKNMLVCHTYDLACAHKELKLKGLFETLATGKDKGHDQNCFCFPTANGSWIVRRHTRGCTEHRSWYNDNSGWTACYYNRLPSFNTASKSMRGIEGEKDYSFRSLREAIDTFRLMGIDVDIDLSFAQHRPATIKQVQDKLILEFPFQDGDNIPWARKKDKWQKVFYAPQIKDDVEIPDTMVRHAVCQGSSQGWFINNNSWVSEPQGAARATLITLGNKREVDFILGKCILNPWRIINEPFKPEYPGDRQWNKDAPQLKYEPQSRPHPYWDKIFNHLGSLLIIDNKWCIKNNIRTGAEYLLCWTASLFQYPEEPLPYLTFFSPEQNTGKSTFHEALSLLVTKGIVRADKALTSQGGYNGELNNAFLCVVEETNLSKTGMAADRIKDWVTARTIPIHKKGQTPFDQPNYTHWIQCTNDPSYCPIFTGDTRIVLVKVQTLSVDIPKSKLLTFLEQESPAITNTLLSYSIPQSDGRLRVPVVGTEWKTVQELENRNPVEEFIEEKLYRINGYAEELKVLYEKFAAKEGPIEVLQWTKREFSGALGRLGFIKGKYGMKNAMCIGNVSMKKQEPKEKLVLKGGRLV